MTAHDRTTADQNEVDGLEVHLDEADRLNRQVRALDRRRSQTVARRAIALQAGLDAGVASTVLADRLEVSRPRIFQMIAQGKRQEAKRG